MPLYFTHNLSHHHFITYFAFLDYLFWFISLFCVVPREDILMTL